MSVLFQELRGSGVVERMGWVLIFCFWQIIAVAVAYRYLAAICKTSNRRYQIGVGLLGVIAALPLVTYAYLSHVEFPTHDFLATTSSGYRVEVDRPDLFGSSSLDDSRSETEDNHLKTPTEVFEASGQIDSDERSAETKLGASSKEDPAQLKPLQSRRSGVSWLSGLVLYARSWMPPLVAVWLLGVVLLSLRPWMGWRWSIHLRRSGLRPVSCQIRELGRRQALKLGIGRAIDVVESQLIQVPMVVGILKPVILLPAAALTNLTTAELESILRHELAHIRRYDSITNLLQTMLETVFFFHPAVWWLSRQVRVERENCCDDAAITSKVEAVLLAKALLRLEESRPATQLILASNGGQLRSRICRLLDDGSCRMAGTGRSAMAVSVATVGFAVALSSTLAFAHWGSSQQVVANRQPIVKADVQSKKTIEGDNAINLNAPIKLNPVDRNSIDLNAPVDRNSIDLNTLNSNEVDQQTTDRKRWTIYGTVTDEQGQPLAGVEVRVSSGMGTLRGRSLTKTKKDGTYELDFGEGVWGEGANTQVAWCFLSKPGFVYQSNSRGVDLSMAMSRESLTAEQLQQSAFPSTSPQDLIVRDRRHKIDFVMTPPAELLVSVFDENGERAKGSGIQVDGASQSSEVVEVDLNDEELRLADLAIGVAPGRKWTLSIPLKGRFRQVSDELLFSESGRYRVTVKLIEEGNQRTLVIDRVESAKSGVDVTDETVSWTALAQPPVADHLQVKGHEILQDMADANVRWLATRENLVEQIPLRLLIDKNGNESWLDNKSASQLAPDYYSALHALAADPTSAIIRSLVIDSSKIEIAYSFREPLRVTYGNGIFGNFRGYVQTSVMGGVLTIDPRTMTPTHHKAGTAEESFSHFVPVFNDDNFVPLKIEIQGIGDWVWYFQVFEGGFLQTLWATEKTMPENDISIKEIEIDGNTQKRLFSGLRQDQD